MENLINYIDQHALEALKFVPAALIFMMVGYLAKNSARKAISAIGKAVILIAFLCLAWGFLGLLKL